MGSVRVGFTSFYVQAVMPAMLAKPLGIYPHVCVSTWSVIEPLTFSNILKIPNNVALYVLMMICILDHASTTLELKIKEAIYIQWKPPTLNRQLCHVNSNLSLYLHTLLCFYCLFCPIRILLYTLNSALYFV